jgi:hypothetical protein
MARRGPGRLNAAAGQSPPHPWDLWFQRAREGEVVLCRGVDFHGRADTFQQQVRNRARKLGVRVGTRVDGGGEGVTFWVRE